MSEDKEIAAMTTIASALVELDNDETRARVLVWAMSRYGVQAPAPVRRSGRRSDRDATQPDRFRDFAELFDVANPEGEQQKALVACYWFQVCEGNDGLEAQTLNTALKNMGHGIGNITKVLGRLQAKKPALVRQVQKAGRSQQARKKYRLTTEGIRAVEAIVGAATAED